MRKEVFVSHASRDRAAVDALCAELDARDVAFWISSSDIELGANWERAIDDALAEATHVVAATTSNALASEYVRAEVQKALEKKKIVIPVLLEKVELPTRWSILQSVDLTDAATRAAGVARLARALPRKSLALLRDYLQTPGTFNDLRALIWDHPEWISSQWVMISRRAVEVMDKLSDQDERESYALYHGFDDTYEKLLDYGLMDVARMADFVVHRQFSTPIALNLAVTFLYRHDDIGVETNSALNPDFRAVIDRVDQAAALISAAGSALFQPTVIVGRRDLYNQQALEQRDELESKLTRDLQQKYPNLNIDAQIQSYSRLLERAEQGW